MSRDRQSRQHDGSKKGSDNRGSEGAGRIEGWVNQNDQNTEEPLVGVTVRIPKKMYWQLTECAAADTRPTANLIRKVLEDYLRANYRPRPLATLEASGDELKK